MKILIYQDHLNLQKCTNILKLIQIIGINDFRTDLFKNRALIKYFFSVRSFWFLLCFILTKNIFLLLGIDHRVVSSYYNNRKDPCFLYKTVFITDFSIMKHKLFSSLVKSSLGKLETSRKVISVTRK